MPREVPNIDIRRTLYFLLGGGSRFSKTSVVRNEIGPLSYTIYESQLEMDERLKHKTRNIKFLEILWEKLPDLGFGGHFVDVMPETQVKKQK